MKITTQNLNKVRKVDLIVGIPSYNEADNIAHVAKQADLGLQKYFPKLKAVIINVDNNSPDNTKDVFLKTETKTPKIYISTPAGIAGKGYNFFNLFNKVQSLKAQAAAVVDADLESITPEWIKELLSPIVNDGFEYITPYYSRSEYDGTITNNICYPIIYGLFGYNIRQPIGGDFAFSSRLSDYWLKKKWHKTTYKYGVDIFMTMHAITGGFKIAQTSLGAKIHKPSAPKLGPMFTQVLSTLFKNTLAHKKSWVNLKKQKDVPIFQNIKIAKPQTLSIDYKATKANSIFGFETNKDLLKRALSSALFKKLDQMYSMGKIMIDDKMWVQIVYEVLYKYNTTDMNNGLIEALKPLYFGRFLSFYKETLEKDYIDSEDHILKQSKLFWKNRNKLINKK